MEPSQPQTPVEVSGLDATALADSIRRLQDLTGSFQLWAGYGHFMVLWAEFDAILELAIMRETKMEAVHSIVVCSGLGFERKASIVRSLLALSGDTNKPAISLINKMVTDAERNALIHSLAVVQPKQLELLRRSTDQKLVVKIKSLDGPAMQAKIAVLRAQLDELRKLLGISTNDVRDYEKTTRSLVSS